MGKWLKKVRRKAKNTANKVGDRLMEEANERLGNLGKIDWGDALNVIKRKGQECAAVSRDTIAICDATEAKREQMIAFASEIQMTLTNLKHAKDGAAALETVKNLTDGSKVKDAMELAKGLEEAALTCFEKSEAMIKMMEDGANSFPKAMLNALEKIVGDDDNDDGDDDDIKPEEDSLVKGLDKDLDDVKLCIENIKKLNLRTAMKVGMEAFTQLSEKAVRAKTLFNALRAFAVDVQEITLAFTKLDVRSIAAKSKDIFNCLGMCEDMREIAQGARKLFNVLVPLFHSTADRISTLWAGLAFAKDCMMDGLEMVNKAKAICLTAKERSLALREKGRSIQQQLHTAGKLNRKSFKAIKNLAKDDGEVEDAIKIARSMDDLVVECAGTVTTMIDRVSEGYRNIPSILTEGMDVQAIGKKDTDPEPLDVEKDVREVEAVQRSIAEADLDTTVEFAVEGFKDVAEKADRCRETLNMVDDFAGNCHLTIDSFLSVWDIESAIEKVEELCRLATLGELMKQFAQEIKKLVLALVALMKTIVKKFANAIPDAMDEAADKVDHAVDKATDYITGKLGKLFR